MKTRHLIGNILIVLSVAFTVYLSVIMIQRIQTVVQKENYTKIFSYELGACAFFILFALDVRFDFVRTKPTGLKVLGIGLRAIVTAVTALLLFMIGKITIASFVRTDAPAKHAIVLGLALENGKPTDDLISRLDTAEAYLQRTPDTTLILTGGNADASGKTEAAVMHDILTGRGVAEEKLYLEDQAHSTKENFKNTARMIDPNEPVVLITSNYHMDRAASTAKSAGFANVLRLPAPSSLLHYGANVMWEVVLELNEWVSAGRRK